MTKGATRRLAVLEPAGAAPPARPGRIEADRRTHRCGPAHFHRAAAEIASDRPATAMGWCGARGAVGSSPGARQAGPRRTRPSGLDGLLERGRRQRPGITERSMVLPGPGGPEPRSARGSPRRAISKCALASCLSPPRVRKGQTWCQPWAAGRRARRRSGKGSPGTPAPRRPRVRTASTHPHPTNHPTPYPPPPKQNPTPHPPPKPKNPQQNPNPTHPPPPPWSP